MYVYSANIAPDSMSLLEEEVRATNHLWPCEFVGKTFDMGKMIAIFITPSKIGVGGFAMNGNLLKCWLNQHVVVFFFAPVV